MYTGLPAEQSIYRMVVKTNYGPRQNKRRTIRQVSWSDFLLDQYISELIDDNERRNRAPVEAAAAASDPKDEDDDFIHILLSVRHEYGLTREQMKAILLVSLHSPRD